MFFHRALIAMMSLFLALAAHAKVEAKLAFEKDLQNRVEEILSRFDPHHRVSVHVSFRVLSAPLPGTDLVLNSYSTASTQLRSSDIEKISVKVQSSQNPLPEWLSAEIRDSLSFKGVSLDLEFAQLPQEQLALMQKSSISGQFVKSSISEFQRQIRGIFWLMLASVVALGCLAFVLLRLRAVQFQQTMREEVAKLVEGLASVDGMASGAGQSNTGFDAQALEKILGQASANAVSGGGEKSFEKVTAGALAHLLSDCYWCGLDGYASWIWKQMPLEKRAAVLKQKPFLNEYSSYLAKITPKIAHYHENADYLKGGPLEQASQDDVKNLLKSHPSLWHQLSQMRKDHLQLKLKDRARLSQSEKTLSKELLARLRTLKSPLRELDLDESITITDLAEEREIFLDPKSIPQAMLYALESLVPLALLPEEDRRQILSEFNTQELATAWVGPEEMLAKLEDVLPEKKAKILRSYLEKQSPSREAPAFGLLVGAAKAKWKQLADESPQKAA